MNNDNEWEIKYRSVFKIARQLSLGLHHRSLSIATMLINFPSSPITQLLHKSNDLHSQHNPRHNDTQQNQYQLKYGETVQFVLDFHRRGTLHAPVIVGSQQNNQLRNMAQTRSIILVPIGKRQIDDEVHVEE